MTKTVESLNVNKKSCKNITTKSKTKWLILLQVEPSLFFTTSPQNKRSINSPFPWHKPILHHIMSTTSRKCPFKSFSSFKNFIPLYEFGLRGSPFPLKISTNKLNIHSYGNLSLDKISLNMFVKDFKHLSPPALNISIATPEGPLAFLLPPHFHL